MTQPRMWVSATVLGAADPQALGAFYVRLLGWTVAESQPDWVMVRAPYDGTGLSFQHEPDYVPPVWPPVPGEQQMMLQLQRLA